MDASITHTHTHTQTRSGFLHKSWPFFLREEKEEEPGKKTPLVYRPWMQLLYANDTKSKPYITAPCVKSSSCCNGTIMAWSLPIFTSEVWRASLIDSRLLGFTTFNAFGVATAKFLPWKLKKKRKRKANIILLLQFLVIFSSEQFVNIIIIKYVVVHIFRCPWIVWSQPEKGRKLEDDKHNNSF